MYIQKFPYTPIPRETIDGVRRYATPDGARLPSVTTILDATKTDDSREALAQWRKNIGPDRADAITKEAANRGTRLHSYLERYVRDGNLPDKGSNPYGWPSHVMAQEVINKGMVNVDEVWGIEVPLYYPQIYAGTTDCVGLHKGSESIIDFKQSNKVKTRSMIDDYFLQLTFYGNAHNELYGTKIRKGVIMMCVKPDLDKNGLIVGTPKYLEFIIENDEWDRYTAMMWLRLEQYYSR